MNTLKSIVFCFPELILNKNRKYIIVLIFICLSSTLYVCIFWSLNAVEYNTEMNNTPYSLGNHRPQQAQKPRISDILLFYQLGIPRWIQNKAKSVLQCFLVAESRLEIFLNCFFSYQKKICLVLGFDLYNVDTDNIFKHSVFVVFFVDYKICQMWRIFLEKLESPKSH